MSKHSSADMWILAFRWKDLNERCSIRVVNEGEMGKISSAVQEVKSGELDELIKVRWHRKGKIKNKVDDGATNPGGKYRKKLGDMLISRDCCMVQQRRV